MRNKHPHYKIILSVFLIFILMIACNILNPTGSPARETATAPAENALATPTPTAVPEISGASEDIESSRCQGLAGEIEIRVVVGPAAAVGLEPFAVGSAPFSVTGQAAPYAVTGGGPIEYSDLLVEEWGTYEVTFQMDTTINGECAGERDNETLALALDTSGEQNVIVDAEGFHGEYPWAGSHTFNLNFPLEDGAVVEGEGYIFILHLEP